MHLAGNLSADQGVCEHLREFIFYSFKLSFPIYILRPKCCVNGHFSGQDLRNTSCVRCFWPMRAKSEQSCSKEPVLTWSIQIYLMTEYPHAFILNNWLTSHGVCFPWSIISGTLVSSIIQPQLSYISYLVLKQFCRKDLQVGYSCCGCTLVDRLVVRVCIQFTVHFSPPTLNFDNFNI